MSLSDGFVMGHAYHQNPPIAAAGHHWGIKLIFAIMTVGWPYVHVHIHIYMHVCVPC